MDRAGQIFDRRYRIERLLGQGGMAAVYVARDRKLDKPVAVKVLAAGGAAVPKAAQRFVQEARAASRVHHPNVVDVTDYGVASDGSAFLVMELLPGEDLARTLEREGPLPWARVGAIALQICAALAAAHRVGVVHRDIKPANCLRLHSAGNPDFIKVLDFGIARVLDPEQRVVEPTTAGTVLGTPEYMAPEVAAGADAGPSADLYAVAALMYKLLTGTPPFVGDSHRAVLSKQIFEPPVPPRVRAPEREIPEAAEALILRALAKDPAERQPDMAALATAIAAAMPQRPAVELWLGTSSQTAIREPEAPEADEYPDPAGELAVVGPTRTLVRYRPERPAPTAPLVLPSARPRRSRRAFALGLGLAAVAVAVAWLRPGVETAAARPQSHVPEDRQEQPAEHVPEDIFKKNTEATRRPARVEAEASRVEAPGEQGPRQVLPAKQNPHEVSPAELSPSEASSAEPGPREPSQIEASAAEQGPRHGARVEASAAEQGPREVSRVEAHPAEQGPREVSPAEQGPREASRVEASPSNLGPRQVAPGRRSPAPRFDADAARRELGRLASSVQTCALDFDMLRGEIAVRVVIDGGGRVAEVSAAPGSRRIAAGALACIRRELASARVEPVAGEVLVTFVI